MPLCHQARHILLIKESISLESKLVYVISCYFKSWVCHGINFFALNCCYCCLDAKFSLVCSILYGNNIYITFFDRINSIFSTVECNQSYMAFFADLFIFVKLLQSGNDRWKQCV